MTLKLVFTTSQLDAQHYRDSVENNRQVYLLCRWDSNLAGLPYLGVVDRWLATPEQARKVH